MKSFKLGTKSEWVTVMSKACMGITMYFVVKNSQGSVLPCYIAYLPCFKDRIVVVDQCTRVIIFCFSMCLFRENSKTNGLIRHNCHACNEWPVVDDDWFTVYRQDRVACGGAALRVWR